MVNATDPYTTNKAELWTMSGNRGDRWKGAEVHLNNPVDFQVDWYEKQNKIVLFKYKRIRHGIVWLQFWLYISSLINMLSVSFFSKCTKICEFISNLNRISLLFVILIVFVHGIYTVFVSTSFSLIIFLKNCSKFIGLPGNYPWVTRYASSFHFVASTAWNSLLFGSEFLLHIITSS